MRRAQLVACAAARAALRVGQHAVGDVGERARGFDAHGAVRIAEQRAHRRYAVAELEAAGRLRRGEPQQRIFRACGLRDQLALRHATQLE
jgi:hypothetical protein